MYVKIHQERRPKGIPAATVICSPGVNEGASQVVVFINALDSFQLPTVCASLRTSTAEARKLSEQLIKAADEADRQAKEGTST
jgi:hypothetical protein